jgi:hypothetical protein
MRKGLSRIGIVVAAVLLLCVVASALYHHIDHTRVLAKYPPPGKLVDIGGRRIQLDCRGAGTPVGCSKQGGISMAR